MDKIISKRPAGDAKANQLCQLTVVNDVQKQVGRLAFAEHPDLLDTLINLHDINDDEVQAENDDLQQEEVKQSSSISTT